MEPRPFRSRVVGVITALAVLAAPVVWAKIAGSHSISVTSTATTVTFPQAYSSVTFVNGPDESGAPSANEYYADLFHCGDTITAATTSSPIRLNPGESAVFVHNPRTEPGFGYCGLSIVTAAAETANARWWGK